MQLSYNNLLYHLAMEWMDTLLHCRSIPSNLYNKKQQQEVDAEVENIENDLSVVLLFCSPLLTG